MKVGEKVIHPVLGRGTVVSDGCQDRAVVMFDKPIKGWDNPLEVRKSFLKEVYACDGKIKQTRLDSLSSLR